jgi:hypothetical protein
MLRTMSATASSTAENTRAAAASASAASGRKQRHHSSYIFELLDEVIEPGADAVKKINAMMRQFHDAYRTNNFTNLGVSACAGGDDDSDYDEYSNYSFPSANQDAVIQRFRTFLKDSTLYGMIPRADAVAIGAKLGGRSELPARTGAPAQKKRKLIGYRGEELNDPVIYSLLKEFIRDCCVMEPSKRCINTLVSIAFELYAKKRGKPFWSGTALQEALKKAHGIHIDGYKFVGVNLRDKVLEEAEEERDRRKNGVVIVQQPAVTPSPAPAPAPAPAAVAVAAPAAPAPVGISGAEFRRITADMIARLCAEEVELSRNVLSAADEKMLNHLEDTQLVGAELKRAYKVCCGLLSLPTGN